MSAGSIEVKLEMRIPPEVEAKGKRLMRRLERNVKSGTMPYETAKAQLSDFWLDNTLWRIGDEPWHTLREHA